MAIRKISDLEKLEVQEVYQSELSSSLDEMLLEVSYPQELHGKSYRSMKTLFGDLAEVINDAILCSSTIVDFYSPITFHNTVSALCSFWLSGNFYVNKDVPDNIVKNFETVMRSGDTTIFSVVKNMLSSNDMNILAAPTNIICSDTQILAEFTDARTTLRSSEGDLYISYPNINVDGTATFTGDTLFTGNATFTNIINGCALCAKWADLAELYESDAKYEPGTLVKFGGEKEITIANDKANAVITTRPGLILGGDDRKSNGKIYEGIALVGRVPVKCIGPVKKFDRMTLSKIAGYAEVDVEETPLNAIGIALENSQYEVSGLVECAVKMSF